MAKYESCSPDDRQKIEAALQESEARFKSFAENSNDTIWITEADEYRLTYVSPSFENMWGRSCDEIYEDLTRFISFVHPEDRDRIFAGWQQCAREVVVQEYRVIRSDGTMIWIRDRGFPLYNKQGDLIWIGGIAEDITEVKQAEAIMKADLRNTQILQELSTRLIYEDNIQVFYDEIAAAAVALVESDGGCFQILDEATQELILIATKGLEARISKYFYRVNANCNSSCGVALSAGRRTFVNFDSNDNLDGLLQILLEEGFLCAQSTPLVSRSGQLLGMVSTHWRKHHQPSERELRFLDLLARQAADLLDRRRSEIERERLLVSERTARTAAEKASRVKDEFLAIVSHELRSPLNPILGWAMLLQTGNLAPDETTEAVDIIAKNAKLQAELINDLLDISRILRGKLSLNVVPVDLVQTIQAAIETVRLAAEGKSIQIKTNLEPDIGRVSGDPNRLQQILWNLLSNAVKFTPSGGRVEVRLEKLDSIARVTVSDTGKGIDPDFLPYVFNYFCQENGTATRKHGGLGLGLAIVNHLVQLHGGTIQVDSAGLEQGATFTLKLPLALDSVAEEDNSSTKSASNLDGIGILLVEDNADTRDLIAFVLEQSGAKTIAVASARKALETLNHFQPDILLSDIGMPEMDGYRLMRQIRALPPERGGNIKAIALTAFAAEIDYQQAMSAGFQEHISKPIMPDKLIMTISSLLNI